MPANVIQTAIVQRARARIHFNWAIVWRRRQRKSAAQRILLKTLRPIVVAQAWSSRAIIHQKSWFFDRKQHLHIIYYYYWRKENGASADRMRYKLHNPNDSKWNI